ncbi:MAG TPA: hypothetical protein VKG78_11610 [Opitutaceae bacterium]|nr:hypothetical protein [Opitutaceae bacterium]
MPTRHRVSSTGNLFSARHRLARWLSPIASPGHTTCASSLIVKRREGSASNAASSRR